MNDISLLLNNGIDITKSLEIFREIEIYNETLKDFLSEVGNQLLKIKSSKESNDIQNYIVYVHSLKTDSSYLGFTQLAKLADNHEKEASLNNMEYINDNYLELMSEADRIIDITSQYLGISSIHAKSKEQTVVVTDKKILIADDSNIIRNFVEKSFNGSIGVVTASDGREAIDVIENDYENSIIGILLDLNMPEVDGFEVLKYLDESKLFDKYPVSIITGDSTKETVDRVFKYPIVDLIPKPFSVASIKNAVDKLITKNKN